MKKLITILTSLMIALPVLAGGRGDHGGFNGGYHGNYHGRYYHGGNYRDYRGYHGWRGGFVGQIIVGDGSCYFWDGYQWVVDLTCE